MDEQTYGRGNGDHEEARSILKASTSSSSSLRDAAVPENKKKLITVRTDSDHAGCVITRRSTTGTAIYHGQHLLRASANTQTVISVSSGESELYAIVRGASAGLGCQSMARDFNQTKGLVIKTDATAGKGMGQRLGAGKVRHLQTQYLWVQDVFFSHA